MQKIMFEHRRFGLDQAVIDGLKEMTRRTAKLPDGLEQNDVWNPVMGIDSKGRVYFTVDCIDGKQRDLYPRYQIGEEVAVAQTYKDIDYRGIVACEEASAIGPGMVIPIPALESAGWNNMMFVRADLMPESIKITNIKLERMQDISDEDCRKEGIIYVQWRQYPEPFSDRYVDHDLWTLPKYEQQFTDAWSDDDPDAWAAVSPKTAFAVLIRKMCGKKAWDLNPWVWVYEFKLIN